MLDKTIIDKHIDELDTNISCYELNKLFVECYKKRQEFAIKIGRNYNQQGFVKLLLQGKTIAQARDSNFRQLEPLVLDRLSNVDASLELNEIYQRINDEITEEIKVLKLQQKDIHIKTQILHAIIHRNGMLVDKEFIIKNLQIYDDYCEQEN